MFNQLTSLFTRKNSFKIQSFTFFIPSPPARASGYREKQFDKVFYDFINKGYEVISLNTQASTGEKQSGMWIICLVRALNKEAELLNLDEIFHDSIKSKAQTKETIDGFYYIDDRAQNND